MCVSLSSLVPTLILPGDCLSVSVFSGRADCAELRDFQTTSTMAEWGDTDGRRGNTGREGEKDKEVKSKGKGQINQSKRERERKAGREREG